MSDESSSSMMLNMFLTIHKNQEKMQDAFQKSSTDLSTLVLSEIAAQRAFLESLATKVSDVIQRLDDLDRPSVAAPRKRKQPVKAPKESGDASADGSPVHILESDAKRARAPASPKEAAAKKGSSESPQEKAKKQQVSSDLTQCMVNMLDFVVLGWGEPGKEQSLSYVGSAWHSTLKSVHHPTVKFDSVLAIYKQGAQLYYDYQLERNAHAASKAQQDFCKAVSARIKRFLQDTNLGGHEVQKKMINDFVLARISKPVAMAEDAVTDGDMTTQPYILDERYDE